MKFDAFDSASTIGIRREVIMIIPNYINVSNFRIRSFRVKML